MWSMPLKVVNESWMWMEKPFAGWSAAIDGGPDEQEDAFIVAWGGLRQPPDLVRVRHVCGTSGWIVARPCQDEPEGILYLLVAPRARWVKSDGVRLVEKRTSSGVILAVVLELGQGMSYGDTFSYGVRCVARDGELQLEKHHDAAGGCRNKERKGV